MNVLFETLAVERRGPVGWLRFNRPHARNAMNVAMSDELPRAWRILDRDPEVSVIVCTGVGEHFGSGVDLDDLADPVRSRVFRGHIEDPERVQFTARDCGIRKPVIAAVNGLCVGGAFMWVVAADFAIAGDDLQLIDPHTSLGQTVGRGTLGLVAHSPFSAAMRTALVGRHERLGAWDALHLGIVTQVVESARLQGEAQRVAELVARNSPAALAASKRAMWRMLQVGLDDGCRCAANEILSMWSHADGAEGPAAFVERRDPLWQPLPEPPADPFTSQH